MRKSSKKIKKLEKLIEEDCSNGRHAQQKIKENLKKSGHCTEAVIQELKELKIQET